MSSFHKEENNVSLHIKRLSLFNEQSENQSSNIKLKSNKFNYTEITPQRKVKIAKNRNSRFKIEQSLAKLSTFQKKSKKKNSLSVQKNLLKQKYISNLKSPKIDNNSSLKNLEKDIQQKIIDISMKIERESSLTNGDNKSILNISYFIKKKLGQESEIESSSYFSRIRKNQKKRNISFNGKKIIMSSLSDGQNHNNKSYSFPIKKFRKPKKNKFRKLFKKKLIYDSFDSEEELDEMENFFISPENIFIRIFDLLISITSLCNVIYFPYYLSNIKCLQRPNSTLINYIYCFIDILYIIDLILGFLRGYINYKFKLIKNNAQLIKHYINSQFLLDLIQAIPFFSYITFRYNRNYRKICWKYSMDTLELILLLCCAIKHLKIIKFFNGRKNYIYSKITLLVSKNDYSEKIFNIFMTFIFYFFGFYFFISVHIFIGQHSYPNWIIKSNSENKSLFILYLTSFYYLLTTMTTVGYGDIVCNSSNELIFQIILLSVGIIIYSWIVSNIGNYIRNESYASMLYNKDEAILEDIRISYPKMPFKLYNKIFHHLNARKMRQKHCDSNILINSLPYSLKNKILLTMYKKIITNFKIFHGHNNSDFTLRLLMNLLPLFSKKNAILIREGQLIENIIFVKEGKLCLEALINIKNPSKSVNEYLYKNFNDIEENVIIVSNYDTSLNGSKMNNNYKNLFNKAKKELDSVINNQIKSELNSSINESKIGKELGKWDFGGEVFEENDYQFINIINISKNESYGNVHMFLSKPSPLCLRVKSKTSELLLLRKYDAFDISKRYPNIWAKIYKKSYLNMLSIKKITIHKIKHYWKNLGKKLVKKQKSYSKFKPRSKIKNKIQKRKTKKQKQKIEEKRYDENKEEIPKIKINNEEVNFINSSNKIHNTNIISFSNKVSTNNLNTNITSTVPYNKSLNNENKYISFGRASSKMFSTNYIFQDKSSLQSGSQKNYKSQRNVNHFLNNKSIPNLRKEYIQKLNNKIKKLKKSKKYYKNYCKNLLLHQKNLENSNNNKNLNMTFESVDKKNLSFEIFNSIIQSPLNKKENKIGDISFSTPSQSDSKSISNRNVLSISSEINLSFSAKYKNLDKLTLGEYSRNRNLRIYTEKFIKLYKSKIKEQKDEKLFDKYLTRKTFNTIFGDYSTNPFYTNTNEVKLKKLMTSDSYSNISPKRFTNNFHDYKYFNNYDEKKYILFYTGKKKSFQLNNSKYNININKNSYKKYLLNKTSSYDSVKKRSSLLFRNISRSNLSSCSSYKKVKDEINKINTKNEYEQEIELKNNENKSPKK